MRAPLEFRYWRKVVTATVGIVLTVGVADVLPARADDGRRGGRAGPARWSRSAATCGGSGGTGSSVPATTRSTSAWRRGLAVIGTVLALALVWFALVAPDPARPAHPGRLPAAAGGGRGPRGGRPGAVRPLGAGRDRRRRHAPRRRHPAQGARPRELHGARPARSTSSPTAASSARGSASCATPSARGRRGAAPPQRSPWSAPPCVCLPWAVGRLSALVSRHRARSARVVVAVAVVWGVCALSGFQVSSGGPVAAADAGAVRGRQGAGRDGGLP